MLRYVSVRGIGMHTGLKPHVYAARKHRTGLRLLVYAVLLCAAPGCDSMTTTPQMSINPPSLSG